MVHNVWCTNSADKSCVALMAHMDPGQNNCIFWYSFPFYNNDYIFLIVQHEFSELKCNFSSMNHDIKYYNTSVLFYIIFECNTNFLYIWDIMQYKEEEYHLPCWKICINMSQKRNYSANESLKDLYYSMSYHGRKVAHNDKSYCSEQLLKMIIIFHKMGRSTVSFFCRESWLVLTW